MDIGYLLPNISQLLFGLYGRLFLLVFVAGGLIVGAILMFIKHRSLQATPTKKSEESFFLTDNQGFMDKFDQKVLCISAEDLRSVAGKRDGLQTKHTERYKQLFNAKGVFLRRGDVEDDASYKQIIPSIILKFMDKGKATYFLHKQTKVSDTRLDDMYPLFLGGHVEEIDGMAGDPDLIDNATMREFEEEVTLGSKILSKDFQGIIYIEDENIVNHMHIGLVWIYTVDGDTIEMNEEKLEKVGFVDKETLLTKKSSMTYRSQVYIDKL